MPVLGAGVHFHLWWKVISNNIYRVLNLGWPDFLHPLCYRDINTPQGSSFPRAIIDSSSGASQVWLTSWICHHTFCRLAKIRFLIFTHLFEQLKISKFIPICKFLVISETHIERRTYLHMVSVINPHYSYAWKVLPALQHRWCQWDSTKIRRVVTGTEVPAPPQPGEPSRVNFFISLKAPITVFLAHVSEIQ